MPTARNITVIPAIRDTITGIPIIQTRKKKVAAYARVSTDREEQQTSYAAQVDYYTNYIKEKPEWEYAGVYTDEGISGTMMKKRDGFNQMIEDALNGKIDLIITKSVSRFARNTVDSLTTIRKLKEKGVEVYFEKENIYTLDSKGELLLTLMSSLAQEESRSLSQNVTWGKRKSFSDGKVSIPYKNFLGYRKGADGAPEIVPEEAKIVRRIYRDFMRGLSIHAIAKELTSDGIKTPQGKEVWSKSTVESILRNEKYKGDALLQKTFTTDYLTKTVKINEGEVPQYYVTGSHPAIIAPEEWDLVQIELERRNASKNYSSSIFAGSIKCGDCGNPFGRKVWHSTDQYRKAIWQCNHKFSGEKCETPHVDEELIKELFLKSISFLFQDRNFIIANLRYMLSSCYDIQSLKGEIATTERELENTAMLLKQCLYSNASADMTEADYKATHDKLYSHFEELDSKRKKLYDKLKNSEIEASAINDVITLLEKAENLPLEFTPSLWRMTVDEVIVNRNGTIIFKMVTGNEYEYEM